ncbi:MAG: hypothetical protein KAQ94_05935 [Arcobacteraceae bacterium]|nr:hypothetical protein [Arcobacteraceae bacterium]
MDNIEIHTIDYGIVKSKDPSKHGQTIGLKTRLIITPPTGAKKILDFDYQVEAIKYIKETYGNSTNIGKTYHILSNYKLYGEKGYQWK